jgi:NAD(P)H-hydrate epimerase
MNKIQIPSIDTDQMREVDRLMIDFYGISLLQMMENAGRNLAEQAVRMLGKGNIGKHRILILCGVGNNGGGGMVAARHLHNRGANVEVQLIAKAKKLKESPRLQWQILQNMDFKLGAGNLAEYDLIIDAMIGYGLMGDPRPPVSDWINRANMSDVDILSLDAPSGLDTSSGKAGTPCIRAAATLTLALPKTGLMTEEAIGLVGELYVADISVPPELYRKMALSIPSSFFSDDSIFQIV